MDYLPFLMLPVAFVLMFLGVQVAFSMMITAVLFGLVIFGNRVIFQFIEKIEDISSNFVFAAVPLFVFMGAMLEKSGIADKLFEAIHIWTRRLPGGLALATVLMCIIFAASSGVIGATESVVGLLTIPIMLRYGYDKPLISGTICAGGSLGTIIPPSVVAVVMGPLANQSVGDLLYGMVFPGLIMGALYLVYIFTLCVVRPSAGPRIPREPGEPSFAAKLWITTRNMVPPVFMIFAVLGSILLGWASPTEAAAVGAFCSVLLTVLYRNFSWSGLYEALIKTLQITAMIMTVLLAGTLFTGVFIGGGGINTASLLIAKMALSPWMLLGADDADHLHRRLLPRLDLDRPHLRAAVHAARDPGGLQPGVVLRPVPDHDPDELSHAADGPGDLLPARGRAAGDHDRSHVSRRRAVHRAAVLHARDRDGLPDARDVAAERDAAIPIGASTRPTDAPGAESIPTYWWRAAARPVCPRPPDSPFPPRPQHVLCAAASPGARAHRVRLTPIKPAPESR